MVPCRRVNSPPQWYGPLPEGQPGTSKPMVRAQFGSSWHHRHSASKLTQHGGFKVTKIMLPI